MEDDTVTLELYVRSLVPRGAGGRLDGILEDLSTLATRSRVDGYEVTVWGDAVGVDGPTSVTRPGAEALATVELFESWADEMGADFPVRETTRGTVADDPLRVLELPPVALAEYRGDDLTKVTPHLRDDAVTTVGDHVGSLLEPSRGETAVDPDADHGDEEVLANPG